MDATVVGASIIYVVMYKNKLKWYETPTNIFWVEVCKNVQGRRRCAQGYSDGHKDAS